MEKIPKKSKLSSAEWEQTMEKNKRYMTFSSDETTTVAVIANHSIKHNVLERSELYTFSTHTFLRHSLYVQLWKKKFAR